MCGIAAGGARPRGVLALHAREMLEDLDSLVQENGSLWWPYGAFIIKGWHNYEVKLSLFSSHVFLHLQPQLQLFLLFPKKSQL